MRIAHVIDAYQSQLGYQESALAECQQRAGHEVHVVTGDRYAPVLRRLGYSRAARRGVAIENGVTVHRLPVRFELPGEGNRVWLGGLEATLLQLHPDFVHVHNILTFTAWRVGRVHARRKFRLVFDSHMAAFNSLPERSALLGGLRRAYYTIARRVWLSQIEAGACALVAVGEPERDFMVSQFGIDPARIQIIRLGADTGHFYPDAAARADTRARWGVPADDVVLVHAGGIRPSKKLELLVEAGLALLREGAPVRVVVIGSGDRRYLQRLQQRAQQSGFARNFNWLPFAPRDELGALLNGADIAVWPGDQSNTIVEAMAVGLPLATVQSEYAVNLAGAGGRYFKADDVEALLAALRPLVCDPAKRAAVGRAALVRVQTELNWEAVSERFLALCG